MSEYTPTTEEVKTDYMNRWMRWESGVEFDRWLAQHEAKVRNDYRDRLIDALRDTKKDLDLTDPFHNGFVTGVDQLIKVLDSVKERANDSFATIYR